MKEEINEDLRKLAEALKEEVEEALFHEAWITTLRSDVIELTVDMGDDSFCYEYLSKLEQIAYDYGCDLEFYAGAEDNDLILILYFYPVEEGGDDNDS
jgi:hypothetical protein